MRNAPPVYVFILSWERPIYLWVSLDSLYRRTTTPCRFVLIDNGSTDPLVHKVISGFERRSMFHAVHRMATNEPTNLHEVLDKYRPVVGRHFAYVESDVSIEAPIDACWLAAMVNLFDQDPSLAMLGSYLDRRDFVDFEAARRLVPDRSDEEYFDLVKGRSPERSLSLIPPPEPVITPFNPPGRLLLLRAAAIAQTGFLADWALHQALVSSGWKTGIATAVRHRHLSLLHVYDEPAYDTTARAGFFDRFGAKPRAATSQRRSGPWWRGLGPRRD